VAGPAIGLLIVALYALANRPLGVSGAYVQVLALARGRPVSEPWRVWFFVGILAGAVVATLVRSDPAVGLQYGALGRLLPPLALVPILFVGGALMGYGARWAGGCTSGHGLSGSSIFSPSSLAAAGTFMATAVALTLLLHVVTGGAL
jgi:uncharacterized protein